MAVYDDDMYLCYNKSGHSVVDLVVKLTTIKLFRTSYRTSNKYDTYKHHHNRCNEPNRIHFQYHAHCKLQSAYLFDSTYLRVVKQFHNTQ